MSKKSIIAIITIIVLLFVAGLSVGIFLYGRGETEAIDGNQVTDGTQNGENVQNSENNDNPTTIPNAGDENTATSDDGNVDGANDNEITNNKNEDDEENTTITTDTNVNNVGETTITRVEEQEKIVSKTFFDWWKPMGVKVTKSKLGLKNVPDITVKKSVETITGVEELVYSGQNITYVIKVTNNGETTVENIEITDKIPQGTTFVSIQDAKIEKGETFAGKTILSGNNVAGVKWIATIPAGKTVEARFTTQVVATEGTIYNIAIANGEESNEGEETKTSIITSNKTSEVTRNNQTVELARVDDLITYTITVKNTGKVGGTIKIEDTVPTGTEFYSVPQGEENAVSQDKKSLAWNVTVPAGEEVKKQFTVKVKDVNGTITNTATVGNTDTEPDIVEVNPNVDISVSKVWEDNNNKHQIRPSEITFNLLANGTKVAEKTISGTSYTFEDFPKYDENKEPITYTVEEVHVGGYAATITGDMTKGYTITNTDKITQTKTSIIKRLNSITQQYDTVTTAKVGDIIEYTITVYNASNTPAIVTITDALPVRSVKLLTQGLNVSGSTITWKTQTVPANGKLELTFKVEVISVDLGTIKNIAKIGKTETEPDEVKVEAYIIFEENGGTPVPDMTGMVGETIADTTMPLTTRKGYVFDGWYSHSRMFHNDKVDALPNAYPAGTTIYYAKWIPASDTAYLVKHHLQDLNKGEYILDYVENLTGTTGALTEALARTYTGFEAKPFNQELIAADGSTVVDIYYDMVVTEGLHVTKTRTAIVDISGNGNISYVDQEGDIIKYTITVTNIAGQKAEGIQVIDNLPVTVTSIKIAGVAQNVQTTAFDRDRNLLEGIPSVSLEPNKSIEITVEYTVTAQELIHALKTDHKKLLNTAIAVLNGKLYTGTDGAGTDVQGEPVINISKSGSTHVNVGGTIQYLITVENTGYVGTTVTVTDELIDTTYIPNSAKIEDSFVEPIISENSNKNKVLTWIIDIEPQATERITFEVTAPNNAFGEEIENTANSEHTIDTGKVEDSSNEVITKVNEVHVVHDEYLEGQLGTDLNIIFILDNSSSMNYPIAGQSYVKDSSYYPIAPTDVSKTRLYNAKEAIKSFIDEHSQNQNTSMSVITFNSTNKGTDPDYMTLMDIEDDDIIETTEKDWVWDEEDGRIYTDVTKYYVEIDGTKYPMTDNKIQGSDGLWYYGVYIPIEHGARCIGSNTTLTNDGLKQAVDNISISSEKSGFGTYIYPAFNEINNNTSKYLSNSKKNIVIVLADGAFSGNYYNQLRQLENNVDEIYCIGFGSGSEYNATALANMSTDGVCYEATDAATLLDAFEQIEESASKQGYGTTVKGEITITEASDTIIISESTPIVVTYSTGHVDANGHHIMETLFECKSEADLARYGLTLSSDKKVISWDAKEFVDKNPGVAVPSTVYLKYYIQRSASN